MPTHMPDQRTRAHVCLRRTRPLCLPQTVRVCVQVDAEGTDPLVLFGGIRTLRHTEVIIFESHRLWANHTTVGLQNLVRWLWQLGYFTFLIGKPCLIKLWGRYAASRRDALERGQVLPPPPGRPAYAQPLSP